MSRQVAAALLLLLVVAGVATACTGESSGPVGGDRPVGAEPAGRLVPVTARAVAAIAAPHVDLELEGAYVDPRTRRHPACPGHRRVSVEADFRGADVHLDLVAGRCRRGDRWASYCGRPPPARLVGHGGLAHGVELRRCSRSTLPGGEEVHVGVQVVHEEGRYRVAERYGRGWRLSASHRTDQHVRIPAAQLVAAVSDPAVGPLVDAGFVVAGRGLPRGGER